MKLFQGTEASSNIPYDSTRSSFVQVTDSSQLKRSSDQSRDHFNSINNEDSEYHTLHIDQLKRDSTTKRKIDALGSFFSSNGMSGFIMIWITLLSLMLFLGQAFYN